MQIVFNDNDTTQAVIQDTFRHYHAERAVSYKVEADLHVAGQKKFGLTQGLATTTVRVAVPTLPALSAAEYVTL